MPANQLRGIVETFVNRDQEIEYVKERTSVIRHSGTAFQPVINFYGVAGIGKTMLMREIYKRMGADNILCALVDFTKHAGYSDFLYGRVIILEDIAAGISSQVGLNSLEFEARCAEFWKAHRDKLGQPALSERQDLVVGAFLDYVDHLLRHPRGIVLVLLFDATENAEQAVLDWLEQEVLLPLLRTEKVVLVIAGRVPWRLKEFQVRRRTYQYRLRPFGRETVEQQLPDYRHLTPKIIEVTFGHPDANRRLVEKVHELEQKEGPFSPEQFDAHKAFLVQDLVEGLIDDKVLADMPVEVRQALHLIAPLRQFDVNALRHLLTHFLPDTFKERSGHYYLTMLRQMVESSVIEWDSARKGYAMDCTVRQTLAVDMQLHYPQNYSVIHEEAVGLYEDWICRILEARSRYLVEKLYHMAEVLRAKEEPDEVIGERLQEELVRYLQDFYRGEEELAVMAGLELLVQELSGDEELDRVSGGCLAALIRMVSEFKPAV